MCIQAEARAWEEEERAKKNIGGRIVKTCHQKQELRDREG